MSVLLRIMFGYDYIIMMKCKPLATSLALISLFWLRVVAENVVIDEPSIIIHKPRCACAPRVNYC